MKNIMKINNILSALTAVLFVTVLSLGSASFVHAQEFDGGFDFGSDIGSGCCGDFGSASYTPTDYGTATYGSTDYGTASYAPDYGTATYEQDYGTATYAQDEYGYGDYGTTGYSTGGYSTGGYSTGGYSTGGYWTGGGYTTPVVHNTTPSNTTITTTTDSHNFTDNSVCSHSVNACNSDDHSVVNITNPAPVINNNNVVANYGQTQVQQYCQYGYSGTYPNCYRAQPIVYQQPPVAYNTAATPYVSLTQVPYTGLDLGFWGSIAYWGAFVLFALFAAYLIAIKRVQNTVASYLKSVLFGSDESEVETTDHLVTAPSAPAPAPEMEGDVIDSFIMSQINRARA